MEKAGARAFGTIHGFERLVGKEDGTRGVRRCFKERSREQVKVPFIHPAATLFADTNPAHEGSESRISRTGQAVEETFGFVNDDIFLKFGTANFEKRESCRVG